MTAALGNRPTTTNNSLFPRLAATAHGRSRRTVERGEYSLHRYPGRRFACPGLLSYRPSGTSDWLAALANGPNVRMSRREQTLSSRKNVRPGRLHPLGLPGKRFARQTVME